MPKQDDFNINNFTRLTVKLEQRIKKLLKTNEELSNQNFSYEHELAGIKKEIITRRQNNTKYEMEIFRLKSIVTEKTAEVESLNRDLSFYK
jgi:predicted RNase H-like nuclease (RuvC/YqgF family)